jgi:hypothetical protein
MSRDEQAIEAEIQAKGKTAPRLTPEHISAQIAAEYSFRASDVLHDVPAHPALACLTIGLVVLKNGFTLVGESACASPENFDQAIGHKIAIGNARAKIWQLEGYVLKNKLSAAA